jgi:hypothetical protein
MPTSWNVVGWNDEVWDKDFLINWHNVFSPILPVPNTPLLPQENFASAQ